MSPTTLVIAHRGASAEAPENTLAAIRIAAERGAHMVELDVQRTADGRLVLLHDDDLERTTNGHGPLAGTTLAELRQLDAGSWFAPRFRDERVPLLTEALQAGPSGLGFNLEIKPGAGADEIAAAVTEIVLGAGLGPRAIVSSFDPAVLEHPATHGLRTGLIVDVPSEESARECSRRTVALARRLGCVAWHPARALVDRASIAHAHDAGLAVQPWTVDDQADMDLLIRQGVDGIHTNDPALLTERLRACEPL